MQILVVAVYYAENSYFVYFFVLVYKYAGCELILSVISVIGLLLTFISPLIITITMKINVAFGGAVGAENVVIPLPM